MPNIETPDELAEALADLIGIYGAHDEKCDAVTKRFCRVCWVPLMTERIRQSVENEKRLVK